MYKVTTKNIKCAPLHNRVAQYVQPYGISDTARCNHAHCRKCRCNQGTALWSNRTCRHPYTSRQGFQTVCPFLDISKFQMHTADAMLQGHWQKWKEWGGGGLHGANLPSRRRKETPPGCSTSLSTSSSRLFSWAKTSTLCPAPPLARGPSGGLPTPPLGPSSDACLPIPHSCITGIAGSNNTLLLLCLLIQHHYPILESVYR